MSASSRSDHLESAEGAPDLRRAYLDEVVTEMWPGHQVSTKRDAVGASYALVPSGRWPVVMVPRRPRRVAAAVLRNYKASADRRTQMRLRLYGLGARLGLADLLPHRITIAPSAGADDIRQHLQLVLGREVVLAVYTSPPRANRKTVLQLLSPGGQTFGFAKIGTNELTRSLVRREADALDQLAHARLASVEAPKLLYRGQWRGFEVLAQRALTGSAKSTLSARALAVCMAEVSAINGLVKHPAAANPYLDNLRSRIEALSSEPYGSELLALLDEVLEAASGHELTLGSWHGDWTPWNMTTDGVKARVWDWERFESGVPVGYDALHHHVQGSMVRGGVEPRPAVRDMLNTCAEFLAPFEVGPEAAQVTAQLYLLEIGTRYAHDRQADAGSRSGRLETWLIPELRGATRPGKS